MSPKAANNTRSLDQQFLPLNGIFTVIVLWLFCGAGYDLYLHYQFMLGAPLSKWKVSFFAITALYLIALIVTLTLIWSGKLRNQLVETRSTLKFWRWFFIVLAAVGVSSFFIFFKQSDIFSGMYSRLLLYALAMIVISWLSTENQELVSRQSIIISMLLLAGIFEVMYNFQHVVDYPFPLYWSEGNRMWDYSIRFGRDLYNFPADEPINAYIDIGRQSLWGMIFLLPHVSIIGMRFWNALVFVMPGIFLGMYLFKSEKDNPVKWLLLALWTFLFLNQGPIYSPLVLAAVLVAAARDMKMLPAILLVGLASYYARSSRITWTFAPAILAAIMAIVDSRQEGENPVRFFLLNLAVKWKRAIILAIAGIFGGFFVQDVLPMIVSWFNQVQTEATPLSMEGIQEAGSRQPLLWERLWPNATNPEGIIPSLLLATGPVIILLVYQAIKKRNRDIWQTIAITGALAAFLVVGLVASVKIGGGSNLHNMDMFLLGIVFTAALAWKNGIDRWLPEKINRSNVLSILMLLCVGLPAARDMMQAVPLELPSKKVTEEALAGIQEYVAEANEEGEVLFIDHRQLLTFGYIQGVPLIADYEKKLMMDMAMANDAAYFEDFHRDLNQQRFSLIVNEPSHIRFQGEDYNFGNENDVWVNYVSIPLLCQYEPIKTYEEVGAQLLVPRKTPLNNENVECPQLPQK